MSDTLQKICAVKAEHVAKQKQLLSHGALEAQVRDMPKPLGFSHALSATKHVPLIAEIKKASPSKGVIREDFDPTAHAEAYKKGGASCLSVLTDEPYFQGTDAIFKTVRKASDLPMLRKDFMIDPYQITESRALGADCVLLIMAALSDAQAKELEDAAISMDMDVLIEVHAEDELERALALLSSQLLGINNRNLKTLEVSLENGKRLAKEVPDGYQLICESGISAHVQIQEMLNEGFHGFLVGESLMRQADLQQATHALLTGA